MTTKPEIRDRVRQELRTNLVRDESKGFDSVNWMEALDYENL